MSKPSKTSPTLAVAYLRVSTDEQRLGPEAQRAAIEVWAARNGVRVVEWHVEAVSGAAPIDRREALLAALASVETHRAGVLVVAKRDRLARDVMGAAMLEAMVSKLGSRIVSAAGEGDGDDPAAILMRRMVDAFSEYERLVIRARTRAALAVKRARGQSTGKAPFGYRVGGDGVHLEPHPAEQDTIARAVALRAEGVSIRAIAVALGPVSRTGKLLDIACVHALLTTHQDTRTAA